jgi:hypothetical protein
MSSWPRLRKWYMLLSSFGNTCCRLIMNDGCATAQAVSCRLPTAEPPGFKPGSGHVGFCDGQTWRWGSFSPRTSVSPTTLHSICFSTIIFTITRGWHNRSGMAAVSIAPQTKLKKKARVVFSRSDAGIVGSNPTQSIDVCVYSVLGSGLATGWSLVQGVLPNALD